MVAPRFQFATIVNEIELLLGSPGQLTSRFLSRILKPNPWKSFDDTLDHLCCSLTSVLLLTLGRSGNQVGEEKNV